MKNKLIIIVVALLASCNNGQKQAVSDDDSGEMEIPVKEMNDSVCRDIIEEKNAQEVKKEQPNRSVSLSRSHNKNNFSHDNMHGFDPASEDDMDDNGMTRYMEANDEEAWD